MVDDWASHTVPAGTTLYHVTSFQHAQNIATNGVQQVANAFGGGRLGQGFYTHTNAGSAALYFQGENPVTLELRLTSALNGQVAPQNIYVADTQADYLTGNDFITAEEDREEIKLHNGDALELVAIWQGGTQFTPADWLSFFE